MIEFLIMVVMISLSGVMMPGPVLAAAIAKGYESEKAGPLIAIGHGAIEFPLMIMIYLGLSSILTLKTVKVVIYLLGGIMLLYLGVKMILSTERMHEKSLPYPSVLMGFITSTSNPYFFLWWATVGSMLILTSLDYGIFGFILFALVHWSCDLGWYSFVTLSVHRSRHLWTEMVQNAVFTCCGLILIIFGVYFLLSLVY